MEKQDESVDSRLLIADCLGRRGGVDAGLVSGCVDTRAREARIRHVRIVRIPPVLDGSAIAHYVTGAMPNCIPLPGLP